MADILPQSSGDFDPEAHPKLLKPLDPSEISIRRNSRKFVYRSDSEKIMLSCIKNDPETPTLDPERDFIWEKNVGRPEDRGKTQARFP